MRKSLLFCIAVLFLIAASAQEEKMETDRPGESLTAEVLQKGTFQTEVGFTREQQQGKDFRFEHPQVYLKFGLLNRLELRAEVTAETQKFYSKNDMRYGLKPVALGLKAKLLEGNGPFPTASLYSMLGIPKLASDDHKAEHLYPRLRLLFQNQLSDKVSLNYNIGAEWEGLEDENPRWLYSFEPQIEVTDKLGVFIESYAFLQKGRHPEHVVDGGLLYDVRKNVRLDVSGGVGLSAAAPDYFVAAGLSLRLKH